uniref:Peptidase C1A papain C-terminal domain-containing protein n=1 Tax=Panagrolaimus sp. PS1159 TaxID=55785 RepID=A0AC35GN48_9BILA
MMNFSIFLFFVFAVAAVNARATFEKKSPTKASISAEEMFRLYEKAKKEVDELNKKYPGATFEINKFSFMSETEKKKYYTTFPTLPKISNFVTFDDENITAPESYDYRDYGKVSPVKNQTSHCGSCYAFAATAAVESQYLIHTDLVLDLSEEYLLECDAADGECEGGTIDHALNVYHTKGVPSEECVPYTGKNGTCPDDLNCIKYAIGGYKYLGDDESKYPGLLFKYGPIGIGLIVGDYLAHYHDGVLDIPLEDCGKDGHAVLLVGYTKDYWIAKNSWGTDRGEEGYFRFKRGVNFCNFNTLLTPVVPFFDN